MPRRRGQDELTRRRRLNDGGCPTHGICLHMGVPYEIDGVVHAEFYCPRSDCSFRRQYSETEKVWKAVCG